MIGSQEIALIRHGGTLINTARAALVDQAALIERLREGTMGAVPMRHAGTFDRLGGSA
jgi:phosphoglycerate dehydrogenase-like enzyme